MVYHPKFTPTTGRMREIIESQERDFPYTAMDADLADYADRCTPWHWHEFFEFGLVRVGSLQMRTQRGAHIVRAGEGYFINANVLHENRTASARTGTRIFTQLFDRSLIAGTGLVGRRYVAPVENCVALETMIFSPETPAGRALIGEMEAAFAAAEADGVGHELSICAHLNAAWRLLFEMAGDRLREGGGRAREESARTKAMLTYIHEHYGESVSVGQIAAAAGVCERECFRSFAKQLDTTPMLYLARHRIGVAARALTETQASIAEVAERCGFSDASYFGKVFRQIMGCAPGEFRKNSAAAPDAKKT